MEGDREFSKKKERENSQWGRRDRESYQRRMSDREFSKGKER